MTIKVEITNTPDVKTLAGIYAQSFGYEGAWSPQDIEVMLSVKGTVTFVAEGHAGFGLIRCVEGDCEILTLAVIPAHRRKGIGKAIAIAMRNWAKEQGAQTMMLEVRPSNIAAQALYRSAGFTALSRLRGDYYRNTDGSFEDALVMQAVLES